MPKAYPNYPYVETWALGLDASEIEQAANDVLSRNPQISVSDGAPLDGLCRALNVDVEYSAIPNEVLLDVPQHRRPVIWLPKNGKPRHDRLTLAMGIGYWILQVPQARKLHSNCGVQALYTHSDRDAFSEACHFAFTLLMPEALFKTLWFEGRAQHTAETLNVPTQAVYDRAKGLALSAPEAQSANTEQNNQSQYVSASGLARRIGPST